MRFNILTDVIGIIGSYIVIVFGIFLPSNIFITSGVVLGTIYCIMFLRDREKLLNK